MSASGLGGALLKRVLKLLSRRHLAEIGLGGRGYPLGRPGPAPGRLPWLPSFLVREPLAGSGRLASGGHRRLGSLIGLLGQVFGPGSPDPVPEQCQIGDLERQ